MGSRGAWKAVGVLGLVQGVLGVLRALQWFRVGSDLSHTGVILLPILGAAAFARGVFAGVTALLYVLFAWGAFTGRSWAWGVGLAACVVNGVAVLAVLLSGADPPAALVWAIAPVLIGAFLLTAGRGARR
jgi:hypothetical protein